MADKQTASVLNALCNLDTSGTSANRGQGGRGFWPGDKPDMNVGEQIVVEAVCRVTGCVFEPDGITYNNVTDPTVHFNYEIIDGEYEGQVVKGERYWIPANSGPAVSEGAQRQREQEAGRFAAYLEDFCGSDFESWGQGIKEVLDVFEAIEDPNDLPVLKVKFEVYQHEKQVTRQTASGEGETTAMKRVKYYREYSLGPLDDGSESE